MRTQRSTALAIIILMVASIVQACTPKPLDATPTAENFLQAFEQRDFDTIADLVDSPDTATQAIEATWEGLQAQSLDISEPEVTHNENQAIATYSVTWQLPRERELAYDTRMVLTETSGQWTVRWLPSIVHPQLGAHQALELRAVAPEKASVVSSDGVELMRPGSVYRILVDTDAMGDEASVAKAISDALAAAHGRDPSVPLLAAPEIESQLAQASGTYAVAVVNANEAAQVGQDLAGYPEIRLNEEAAMVTSEPGFAADIMSRVGPLVADQLEGAAGWKVSIVSPEGAEFDHVAYTAPQPAPAVRVSVDRDVQQAAEDALAGLGGGRQAVIVAMRPSTGEVLAVAQTEEADAQGNIGLVGQYPPGSIFKIITAAAGIHYQGLTTGSIVGCPGTQNIFGRVVTNYQGFALGNVPLDSAFKHSCNTTFADISTRLAPGELEEVAKTFGLGVDYQISGLDTVTGSVPVGEEPLDRTEAGYGQGLTLASPFGFTLVSATAAAGHRPTPYLIAGAETIASEDPPQPDPVAIEQVQSMMRSVVTSGTAARMTAAGDIRGKTGEAEVNDGSHAWFTGYRDDLAFTTLVVYGGGSNISVDTTDRFLNRLDELKAG